MKRILLLLILFCSITVSAQQKQRKIVKLTTRQGVSYVGFLEELKTFEYVLLEVGEKRVQIPFDDMAYIDELKRIEPKKDEAKKEVEVKKGELKVEEVPKPIEVKIPEHETEPVVAKVELEKVEEAPNLESLPVPVPVAEPEPEPVVAPVVKEPELKAELLKVVEPEPAPETVSAKVTSKFANYHGFLLEEGNNVYLSCLSSPKNVAYDDAAIDVLTRQILRDGFWHIV